MKTCLELGAGPRIRSRDFIGEKFELTVLDARDDEYTDIIHEITIDNKLPFPDESFDIVFNSHIFEHFPYNHELTVMRDWVRVLKTGGVIYTVVPSWEWVAQEVLKSPEKRSSALKGIAFAGQINEYDVHYNMFTLDMLEDIYHACRVEVRTCSSRKQAYVVAGRKARLLENFIVGVKK